MFSLLTLDDDSIALALGFGDAFFLSTISMTCRRLCRLADLAWADVERTLPSSLKSERGSTPRRRMLSAILVSSRWDWMKKIAKMVETQNLSFLNRNGYQIATPELLSQAGDYILFINIAHADYGWKSSYHHVSEHSCTLGAALAQNIPADLPMTTKGIQRKGNIHNLITSFYSGPEESFTHRIFLRGRITITALDQVRCNLFKKTDLSIIAFDKHSLTPHILIKNHGGRMNPKVNVFRLRNDSHDSYRLEVSNDWVMTTESEKREICFYFQNDSFGLRLYTAKHAEQKN